MRIFFTSICHASSTFWMMIFDTKSEMHKQRKIYRQWEIERKTQCEKDNMWFETVCIICFTVTLHTHTHTLLRCLTSPFFVATHIAHNSTRALMQLYTFNQIIINSVLVFFPSKRPSNEKIEHVQAHKNIYVRTYIHA